MKLLNLRVHCPQTIGDLALSMSGDGATPRNLTLIYGGPGSGKTTLLTAVAATRPGHTVALGTRTGDAPFSARCEWWLGLDNPDREHPLVLQSPTPSKSTDSAPNMAERQAARQDALLCDRLAKEGGFVFLSFSASRWFSKGPVVVASPPRFGSRYDTRADLGEDATRSDLGRDVKQALAHAAIVRALPHDEGERDHLLGVATRTVVAALIEPFGLRYLELDKRSLEPRFEETNGRRLGFDALPTAAKHAIAFGALTLRALWLAYPGMDPRRAQGVVAIDQIELHQDVAATEYLIATLTQHLPDVQWLLTTRASELLATRNPDETYALHRIDENGLVGLSAGDAARVH